MDSRAKKLCPCLSNIRRVHIGSREGNNFGQQAVILRTKVSGVQPYSVQQVLLQSSQKMACSNFLQEFFPQTDVLFSMLVSPFSVVIRARDNLDSACEMIVSRNYSIVNFIHRNSVDYLANSINLEAERTVTYEVLMYQTMALSFN